MKALNLSNNNITALPANLSALSHITCLSITNNPFESFPAVVESLKTLRELKQLNLNIHEDTEAQLILNSLPQLEYLNEQGMKYINKCVRGGTRWSRRKQIKFC